MEYLPLQRAVGDSLTAADAMTVEATALLGGHCSLLTAARRGDPGTRAVLDRVLDAGFLPAARPAGRCGKQAGRAG
jgi:hypothetical protein